MSHKINKGSSRYRKIIIRSIFNALLFAFPISWYPALSRIKSLEIGEYPGEPAEIISARLQEMRPIVIREAVLAFILLMVIFFIIFMLFWSKRNPE